MALKGLLYAHALTAVYSSVHLVDELSVYPAYGVPSVPVQLLWAGSLQLLPHTL